MNPLTNVKNLQKINDRELQMGLSGHEKSWHSKYKNSAWIYFGGVNFDLTEGDLICIFSQYGEIVNINLVRDKKTGKSRGFGFICYEDQRSTVLSVDNFNGIKVCNRIIRVDHVENYKPPKDSDEYDELTKLLHEKGCAPEVVQQQQEDEAESGKSDSDAERRKSKKDKKKKSKKKSAKKKAKKHLKKKSKKHKHERKRESSSNSSSSSADSESDEEKKPEVKVEIKSEPVSELPQRSSSENDQIRRDIKHEVTHHGGREQLENRALPSNRHKNESRHPISTSRRYSRSPDRRKYSPRRARHSRSRSPDRRRNSPEHRRRSSSPGRRRRSRSRERYRR